MIWSLQGECEHLKAQLDSCQQENAEVQKHAEQLTEAADKARADSRCSSERREAAEQNLQQLRKDCDRWRCLPDEAQPDGSANSPTCMLHQTLSMCGLKQLQV